MKWVSIRSSFGGRSGDDDAHSSRCENEEEESTFNPIRLVYLPSDVVAEKIASRTSLVKYIVHLWGSGTNDEELKTSVRKGKDEAWLDQSMTYKLTCCDFGATRSNEKSEVMRRLSNLVPGAFEPRSKVSLDQPRVEFLSM